MTDVARLSTLRYALHSNAQTFSGTPGSLVPLRLTDDGEFTDSFIEELDASDRARGDET